MMQHFDIHTLPLDQNALIEASAGTGKTFTIVNLVLRYLLEPWRGGAPLTIERILVVTFTRAAVDELRGRIRKRVEEALNVLEGNAASTDTTLLQLLQPYRQPSTNAGAVQSLRLALLSMDEASVSTIHGFCQRALSDFAFEGGEYFEHNIISDQNDLLIEVTQQFWREHFYAAPRFVAEAAMSLLKSPDELLRKVRAALRPDVMIEPSLDGETYRHALAQYPGEFTALSQQWFKQRNEIWDLFENNTALNKKSYDPKKFERWFIELDAYFSGGKFSDVDGLANLPKSFVYFTTAKLDASVKKNCVAPHHALFDVCEAWSAKVEKLSATLLGYAAGTIRNALQQIKKDRRVVYFDDLLTMLDAMLMADASGELAGKLRARYPVALIDEFQDTDSIQYRIFSTLYGAGQDASMLLIGDPKQAIYAFRGADINTYVDARGEVPATARYTLARNYRSSERVVESINCIFTQCDDPFAFRGSIGFSAVEFEAANNVSTSGALLAQPGFNLCWLGGNGSTALKRGAALDLAARFNAARIAQMLDGTHSIKGKRVAGKDIAILVRDSTEAAAMRDALRSVGVDSVFLSKDSVFATLEAMTMYRLLCACARPRKAALIRAVLGSELLAMTAQQLLDMNEMQWSAHGANFHKYHRLWISAGFYVMWRTLLRDYPVAENLLRMPGGERCQTNINQLAELIERFEHSHLPDVTLRWFAQEMSSSYSELDDQVLRLESEANLVQVVTMHRSKGLEYPVVFLPFLFRYSSRKDNHVTCHDDDVARVVVDFGGSRFEQHALQARAQQRAENVRLLYVALTRAKYHCVVTSGNVEQLQNTALHDVLFGVSDTAVNEAERWRQISAKIADDAFFEVSESAIGAIDFHPATASVHAESLQARQLHVPLPSQHRMHSYSSIVKGATLAETGHDFDPLPDVVVQPPTESVEATVAGNDIFAFPRGANAGTFWHEVLELWSRHPDAEDRSSWIAQLLQRYGFDAARWAPVVIDHLARVLDQPLLRGATGSSLAQVAQSQQLAELEFFLPLSTLDADRLWRLVADSRRARGVDFAAAAQSQSIDGMLKGYIDAVLCIDGQYYVVDYKTNHLGNTIADYSPAAMEQEIVRHDYDLQFLIYCVAVHRMLRRRIAGYDYDCHFGGVLYLFIRGFAPGSEFGIYRHKPSLAIIEQCDALFSNAELAP